MKRYTTVRTPVDRSMPSIAKACAAFKGFAEGGRRSEQVFEHLSTVIQRYRRSIPQRFYAMREVAAFFGITLSMAALVYRRLEREGVLTLMRGSQTMIAARTPRPRFALRGVVCMPIWLPAFVYFQDWRRWFSQLEEEFSRYRFVLEPVFYRQGEEINPDFVDRVLRFNPDYVLWPYPDEFDCMTMDSIADAGVPLVVIQNREGRFPGRIYRTSHVRGLQRGLEEWEASGEVTNIVIPQGDKGGCSATMIMKPTLEACCSLPYRFPICLSDTSLPEYLRRLAPTRKTGIIFDDDLFYSRLCLRLPEMMLALFRRHRVMVMRQVMVPCAAIPSDVTVDALLFPVRRLARRIALDLSNGKGATLSQPAVYQAEWRPRTPLAEVIQLDVRE